MVKTKDTSGEIAPVFITQDELSSLSDDAKYRHEFYVDEMEPVLEAKRASGADAITQAASLLLTRSAVALVHIDVTRRRESYGFDNDRIVYEGNDQPIGFNDHGGGSESQFKILLNGSPSELDREFVLYSPPDNLGNPTNTTFHRADFTFLCSDSTGPYSGPGHVPNPLKTSGAHMYRGGVNYKYYLFGGPEVPKMVYKKFDEAGFSFKTEPYIRDLSAPDDIMTTFTLLRHERIAAETLGYRGFHFWPGDQFAENLKLLGVEVPKFSSEDYPLVRPENMLQA